MPLSTDGIVAISSEPEERTSNKKGATYRFYKVRVVSQEPGKKFCYYTLDVMVPLIEVKQFLEKAKKPKIFYLRDGILQEWNGQISIKTSYPRDFIPLEAQLWA